MEKEIKNVHEFHTVFKQVVNETPQIPDKKTCVLRLSLILEELTEAAEAMGSDVLNSFQRMLFDKSQKVHYMTESQREKLKPSPLALGDALTDLSYVVFGTYVAAGMQSIAEPMFDEVHRSNMSKACKTLEIAIKTCQHYKDKGENCYHVLQPDGTYLVFRDGDKKVLKSIEYSPADLTKFIPNVV